MIKIGIIGSAVVDYICACIDTMPELGEHTCFDEFEVSSGGNGQNVAINLCKLGVPL